MESKKKYSIVFWLIEDEILTILFCKGAHI